MLVMAHEGEIPELAERMEMLFRQHPDPDGEIRSNYYVSHELRRRFGVVVSPQYISYLRSGRRTNPSAALLHAIASIFDVPITYFFDDTF